MLGFKRFETAAVTIRGIELAEKIKKHQFNLRPLIGKAATLRKCGPGSWQPELWKHHSPDKNIHLIEIAPEPFALGLRE